MDILQTTRRAHFIGIGGIGISAVARLLHSRGVAVTGNDLDEYPLIPRLREEGINITIGRDTSVIPTDVDIIVYSVAWESMASELMAELRSRNTPLISYPEFLGRVSRDYYTIAIAGTHGKTTTTAMIAKVMIDANLDPTVIVGSIMTEYGSNFVAGHSRYLVVEADEYRRAFLNLTPSILVITNIASDHLDYYKDLADIQDTFNQLEANVVDGGHILRPTDWQEIAPPTILSVPGKHNREDAQAALAVAQLLDIPRGKAERSLADFKGTWRRFEYKGLTKEGAKVYDDYAHNPDKVRASLQGAREMYPDKKIVAVFQPHLYSRTKSQLIDFGRSFGDADTLVLLPIYGARENPDPSIDSEMLAHEIKKNSTIDIQQVSNFSSAESLLHTILSPNYVVLIMGAGDVTQLASSLMPRA